MEMNLCLRAVNAEKMQQKHRAAAVKLLNYLLFSDMLQLQQQQQQLRHYWWLGVCATGVIVRAHR